MKLAQQIYAGLYMISLILSSSIYYGDSTLPNWILGFLPLSKRLHSIYVLRLFNDCWATVGAQAAILAFQNGFDILGLTLTRWMSIDF
jgi:alpha-1,3-mannosyltransferase